MNADDFIVVANDLAAGPTEAHWRSAVSRAYYGAFHVALRLLASAGVSFPKTAAAHEKVAYCLQNADDAALLEAGRRLASLREVRNAADYRLDDAKLGDRKRVSVQLGRAEEIIAAIAFAEQNIAIIRQPIRDYARSVLTLTVQGED